MMDVGCSNNVLMNYENTHFSQHYFMIRFSNFAYSYMCLNGGKVSYKSN